MLPRCISQIAIPHLAVFGYRSAKRFERCPSSRVSAFSQVWIIKTSPQTIKFSFRLFFFSSKTMTHAKILWLTPNNKTRRSSSLWSGFVATSGIFGVKSVTVFLFCLFFFGSYVRRSAFVDNACCFAIEWSWEVISLFYGRGERKRVDKLVHGQAIYIFGTARFSEHISHSLWHIEFMNEPESVRISFLFSLLVLILRLTIA